MEMGHKLNGSFDLWKVRLLLRGLTIGTNIKFTKVR